jgi:hypothetical protein
VAHYEDTLRYEINSTVDTVAPAPAIAISIPKATNKNLTPITINGERDAKIFVNNNYTDMTIDSNHSAIFDLNTTGDDGYMSFIITLQDDLNQSSNELNITILKDTIPPAKPTVNSYSETTNRDRVRVTIFGEDGATLFINDINMGILINGSLEVDLDTSGSNGSKEFNIVLVDLAENRSNILNISITKEGEVATYNIDTTDNSGDIELCVEDNSGNKISNASIQLEGDNWREVVQSTGADGYIRISGVPIDFDLKISAYSTTGQYGEYSNNPVRVSLNEDKNLLPCIIVSDGESSITGVVQKVLTQAKLKDVKVTLSINSQDIKRTLTNENGTYSFNKLSSGLKYSLRYEKEDYTSLYYHNITVDRNQHKYMEVVQMSKNNEVINGIVSGIITNALNGNGVDSATLVIREGQNNTNGTIFETIQTTTNGEFTITLPPSTYTAEVIKDGYITSYFTIISISGETNSNQNFSISPIVTDGDMRIVLTWGENPSDLDSHLVRKTNGSLDYHIYYYDKYGIDANLDHDDITSYGPETVTLNSPKADSVYTYFVHHYYGYGNLKSSRAKVNLSFNGIQRTFNVPNEDGIYWKVFEIVNGSIIPCSSNCIQSRINSNIVQKPTDELSNIFRNLPNKGE